MTDVDETRALKAAHERVKAELREFKALFKEHPQDVTLAEPVQPVLRECRVVRYRIVEVEPADHL